MKYYVHPSFTDDMGSYVGFHVEGRNMDQAKEEALWHYNSARNHDGLPNWESLPHHIKVERQS
jgi:hypothetical protein